MESVGRACGEATDIPASEALTAASPGSACLA